MFSALELNMLDRSYFRVIGVEEDVISLESKNTHHGWYLYRPLSRSADSSHCIIFHRHEDQVEYHKHGQATSFKSALRQIRRHDRFQIDVRWKGRSYAD